MRGVVGKGRNHGPKSAVFAGCGVIVWVFVGWCSGANWSLEPTGLWSQLVSGVNWSLEQNGHTKLLVSGAKGSPELCVLGVVLLGVGVVI